MPSNSSLIRSLWAQKRGKLANTGLYFPSGFKTSYSSAGDNSFVVPSGVTTLGVKAWGAGGGAASTGFNGGAGSFIQTTISVTPGETLTIRVGGSSSTFTASSYGGGGNGGDNASADGGAGGGYSGVLRSSTILCCAAGGGGASPNVSGGGGDRDGTKTGLAAATNAQAGGVDHGGIAATSGTYPGATGTAGAGGAGGNGSTRGGGGGGGGYYGGAGGNGGDNAAITGSGSGAGGSSFLPTTPATGFINTLMRPNGVSATAPNSSDPDYVSGKGAGAVSSGAGGSGLVVISYA